MVRSRRATAAILVGVITALPLLSLACTRHVPKAASTVKPPLTPALLETGRRLYEKQCASCHGPTGAGDGPAAYLLYPKPRDFTQNEFRLVSTTTMQATDEDLFQTITRGMPGSSMPPWETLSLQQRWALVYYVRHLTGVNEPIDPASIIQTPPETPKTSEGVARGRDIFAQACASCHGPQGRGDGLQAGHACDPDVDQPCAPASGGMVDNLGYPVRPRDLTAGIFKGSSESRDVYDRIVAGLPGSPMPSYAGAYTDEQLWDLIHYVQSLVPPGVEERVRLKAHTIRARRIIGDLPTDPSAPSWQAATPVEVAVTPLWWRDHRIERLEVKAMHNRKALAIHLAWDDPTRDDSLVSQQAFSDGVAVQLSTEPDPPFFGMGGGEGAVHLWHWKASWQEDVDAWRDVDTAYPNAAVDWYEAQRTYQRGEPFEVRDAKTTEQDPAFMSGWGAGNPLSNPHRTSAGEEAVAKGLGTLTSRPPAAQRVQAHGVWHEGRWQVVLRRPFDFAQGGIPSGVEGRRPISTKTGDDLVLRSGQQVSVAFAVWDGHANDRNGQKSVSIWNTLQLER